MVWPLLNFILLMNMIIIFIFFVRSSKSSTDNHSNLVPFVHRSIIRVAIINAVRYHGEIWYSSMYVAAIRCHWHVSLFTVFLPANFGNENGLSYMTRSWSRLLLSRPQQHVNELLQSISTICSQHIIIICTLQNSRLEDILDVLLNKCDKRTSYLVLVQIHQGSRDISECEHIINKFQDFFLQKRIEVRYLALAEHVKEFAKHNMTISLNIDIWRCGFPLDLPIHDEEDQFHQYFDFIIQGKIEDNKRNYSGFINEIKHYQNILDQHRIVFTILGNAKTLDEYKYLQVPSVRLFLPPNYMPASVFFSFIHQAVGIITIFSIDKYYIDRQSSSIVCSILTQTPLIASQRLLDTHKYIPEEAVWIKHDNETDVTAILRMIKSFPSIAAFRKALFTKRQQLKHLLEQSYVNNERTLNDYVTTLEQRIV